MNKIIFTLSLMLVCSIASNAQSLNGTYVNEAGQKLIVTSHIDGKSFAFSVQWGVKDKWECIFEEEGDAIQNDAKSAYYGSDAEWPNISFSIEEKVISLSISPELIGMDCARYGDSTSEIYTSFKKQ